MKDVIKNKNLFIAEKLLEIIAKKPYRVHGSGITLEKEDVYELSSEEVVESLKRLEYRKIVGFDDEEDKYDSDHLNYITLYFEKDKLVNFVETAKDSLYKIPQEYPKKELSYVLEALASIRRFESSKEPANFSEFNNKYIDVCIWIADYSGALRVIYDDEPDVEWKDTKRPVVYGISEVPKKFIVIDAPTIRRLENEIRQLVIMPQEKRIKLFLKDKVGLDWKCANCGHFLREKLEDQKQIADCLNDFRIRKFRVCYKCRKRNYFTINQKGELKFLITRKLMFNEIEKEAERTRAIKFNLAMKTVEKITKELDRNKEIP